MFFEQRLLFNYCLKNNRNKTEKTFKEEGMLLPKKELIQGSGVGKLLIIVRIYIYNSLQHTLTTPIHCNNTHIFHPLATPVMY